MEPNKEEKSWVLSAAVVLIPMILILLALWLWPKMGRVYLLPDSAVITYKHALYNAVPPGAGHITRINLMEQALAGELGQLSDLAANGTPTNTNALTQVLQFNAQLGRWAAVMMAIPPAVRLEIFNWGLQSPKYSKNISLISLIYDLEIQVDPSEDKSIAATLLKRWKQSLLVSATMPSRVGSVVLNTVPNNRVGNSKSDRAALIADMQSLSKAISALLHNRASALMVNSALAAEFRTIIRMTTVIPWQKQLLNIMRFNAAMSHWMYLIEKLPPVQTRDLFNWARFRTQDVELIRMAMSRHKSQRLQVIPIAPKLHSVERVWLIHRLLSDPNSAVVLAILNELWNMPPSPRLVNMLWNWVFVEPLPKGHDGPEPWTITFEGHPYKSNHETSIRSCLQSRDTGGNILYSWDTPLLDPLIVQVCKWRAEDRLSFGPGSYAGHKNPMRFTRIFLKLFALREPHAAIPFLLRIIHEPVSWHSRSKQQGGYLDNRSIALWMLLTVAGKNPLQHGFIKEAATPWSTPKSKEVELREISQITAVFESVNMRTMMVTH